MIFNKDTTTIPMSEFIQNWPRIWKCTVSYQTTVSSARNIAATVIENLLNLKYFS